MKFSLFKILICLQFMLTSLCVNSLLAAEPTAPFQVGVLFWSSTIPGQVAMRKGLEEETEKINAQALKSGKRLVQLLPYVAGDGPDGRELQITQMRQLIGQKVDLIIVQPTDNAALSRPLQEANQAEIPVVAYDQYIDGGKLTCYLTSDNYQAGFLDGEYTAHSFPKGKELKIILVEYPHVSSTVERVNGFLDALKKAGRKIKILKAYNAVEPVSGAMAGKEILNDFPEPNSVDVVFTVNDGGGLSVVDVLSEARRDEIFVATVDGDPKSVENIKQKRLTRIDSAQFCGALGANTIHVAYQVLLGKKVPRQILVPTFPIVEETLLLYKGWDFPIPARFKKSWESAEPFWESDLKMVASQTGEKKPFTLPCSFSSSEDKGTEIEQ